MAKPNAQQIGEAAAKAGLRLSSEDVTRLDHGQPVGLKQEHVAAPAGRGCSGIKLVDLGGGCGLYFTPFPPQISVCCET
jgi:hypothetical protein